MNTIRKAILTVLICCSGSYLFAQTDSATGGQADIMMSEGKIYVVMAVVVIIVLGIFIYLFSLDRKIRRLEKDK